jgi:uncharacterized protein
MLRTEAGRLGNYLKQNRSELGVISLGLLFLILRTHHPIGSSWQSHLFYYFILPILSTLLIFRRNPLDFGLRLGAYRIWAAHLLVICPVIFILLLISSNDPAMTRYYRHDSFDFLPYAGHAAARIFAWEYIFRGFLLFGLKESMQERAIVVQMIPFTILHIGKPEIETISCIISGIYFGYVSYRGNSFWPAFLIHLYLNLTLLLIVNYLMV